jgi:hypothetical protein
MFALCNRQSCVVKLRRQINFGKVFVGWCIPVIVATFTPSRRTRCTKKDIIT